MGESRIVSAAKLGGRIVIADTGARAKLYIGEIFPTRIREGGVAIGAATQWLFNFTFSQITPHAVTNLGWKVFLMFAIFNWALVLYTWFFIKEVRSCRVRRGEAARLVRRWSLIWHCRPKDARSRRWSWVSWPLQLYFPGRILTGRSLQRRAHAD